MTRNLPLKKSAVAGERIGPLPKNLDGTLTHFIKEVEADLRRPSETWDLLTTIYGRIDNLSQDSINFLEETNVIRSCADVNMSDMGEVQAHLDQMISPYATVREDLVSIVSVDTDNLAAFIFEIGQISEEAARFLLEGRLKSAETRWFASPADLRDVLSQPFHQVLMEMARCHILDSIWEAAREAHVRLHFPTGLPFIDGEPGQIPLIGSVTKQVALYRHILQLVAQIKAVHGTKKQEVAYQTVFESTDLDALARRWEKKLAARYGRDLPAVLDRWTAEARPLAEAAISRVAGAREKVSGGRVSYDTVAEGHAWEHLWLTLTVTAYWLEKSRMPNAAGEFGPVEDVEDITFVNLPPLFGRSLPPEPKRLAIESRREMRLLFSILKKLAVRDHRTTAKHTHEKGGRPAAPSESYFADMVAEEQMQRSAGKQSYLSEYDTKANRLWDRYRPNSLERRRLTLETFGRFWFRLRL
jgi:hypothetical protein